MGRTIVGAIIGLFLGWVVLVAFGYLTGSLFMPEPEYQKRASVLTFVLLLIEGVSGFLGGLWGFRASKRSKLPREFTNQQKRHLGKDL